ncbi:MAG TPA: class I SAM-dependent methyltransferase [Terriglobales bacterium]|nr:class I SAM-dependent methyltransferase [Terriglobales bacterium]
MSLHSVAVLKPDSSEVKASERFPFGKNWQRFLKYLTEERIAEAEKSLRTMLEVEDLRGKSFLDIGCGSGLFSLAAMRLGASKVHSFDFDPDSVDCVQELKRRYFATEQNWTIQQGSVLDPRFLSTLRPFDVVYSWGVLHHTGNMWQALENVIPCVGSHGKLFIGLYNDQDVISTFWTKIKKQYNHGPVWRLLIVSVFTPLIAVMFSVKDVFFLQKNPLSRYREYKRSRGMAWSTDLLDWLGGYPFEVARPEAVFDFVRARGFEMVKLKTAGITWGINEFVFVECRPRLAT